MQNDIIYCPVCQEASRRLKRNSWMRLVPFSRHIYCNACHERFYLLFGTYVKLKRMNII